MCQCCLCTVRAISVRLARSQFGEVRHSQRDPRATSTKWNSRAERTWDSPAFFGTKTTVLRYSNAQSSKRWRLGCIFEARSEGQAIRRVPWFAEVQRKP